MKHCTFTMRTDISKYVIHSIRRPNKNDLPQNNEEEQLYYPLAENEEIKDEFESLVNIIEEGLLRASRSFRNGKATVYGGDPVVCFTEMPLLNFIQYVKERNNRYRFTEYGIALLKEDVYKNYGRPVIAGLAKDNLFEYEDQKKRIIKPEILPYKEQFRYVNLDLKNGTDWTHEREWRIKCDFQDKHGVSDYYFTWGVSIFSSFLFSEAIIILKTEEEARTIQSIVQKQLDNEYSRGGQEFCNNIKYLVLSKAIKYFDNNSLTRIEDLPANAFYTHSYKEINEQEKQKIKEIISECIGLGPTFADEFAKNTTIEKDENGLYKDTCGFSHVASYKTTNKYLRYLLKEKIATPIDECLVLYELQEKVPFEQSMSYHEYIAQKQCAFLNKKIENIFTTYSIID